MVGLIHDKLVFVHHTIILSSNLVCVNISDLYNLSDCSYYQCLKNIELSQGSQVISISRPKKTILVVNVQLNSNIRIPQEKAVPLITRQLKLITNYLVKILNMLGHGNIENDKVLYIFLYIFL